MPCRDDHNASYDYARLIAVVGVIWFHAGAPGALIGYSGLAFFLMLLVHLTLPQAARTRDIAHRAPAAFRFAAARARRLLWPWLLASLAYGALKMVEVLRGAPWTSEFQMSMWLTGPALHLWFLPFAFAVCLALWPLARVLRHLGPDHRTPLACLCTGLALVALALTQEAALAIPIAQWAYALPAVLFGTALALLPERGVPMLGLLTLFLCCALAANWTTGLPELGLASLVMILCRLWPLAPTPLSQLAARWALALFLLHPAVQAVAMRSGVVTDETTALAIVVTLVSCALIALWEAHAAPRLPGRIRMT